MAEEKIKRSYLFDPDVVSAFDLWIERTGMEKQIAAQLGLWVVMRLDPETRQSYMDQMTARDDADSAPAPAELDAAARGAARAAQKPPDRKAKET